MEILQALSRYIASHQWAEAGKEAVILDRMKGAANRLPELFRDWKMDLRMQEDLMHDVLGFAHRENVLPACAIPVLPKQPLLLRQFLAIHNVLLYKPTPVRAVLATSDPLVASSRDQVSLMLGMPVDFVYMQPDDIDGGRKILGRQLSEIAAELQAVSTPVAEQFNEESGPVVQLVELTIQEAVQRKASDIHVEPFERQGLVRYRVDGVLVKGRDYDIVLHPAITSRIKLIAGLDIAERRLPQDGRIRYEGQGADFDIRVATIPSNFGEAIVMRMLARSSVKADLEKGGFRADTLAAFRKSFSAAQGIILVTGPTGSGKTTTLYGMLAELNEVGTKIFTIEDPIEYVLEGVVQVPVNHKVGLDFAAGLRSFLRCDPDIIMVGEIRDHETAEIAIKSALTGHLVLATLHTNSAPATLTRLLDMGVERYNLSATVQAILAQRLLRRVCPSCAVPVEPSPGVGKLLAVHGMRAAGPILREAGCEQCGGTGYRGRLGCHEFLTMTPELKAAVNRAASEEELAEIAARGGMAGLMKDGLHKVLGRETTIAEVLRVLGGTIDD